MRTATGPSFASLLFLCLPILATSSMASAHDPWESNGLAINPGAPNDMVLRTNRGVAFSTDGGRGWTFVCRVALDNFSPAIGVTGEEMALLGGFDGLSVAGHNGCDFRDLYTPMTGLWVADLQLDPTNTSAWFAATSRGGAENGVFRSEDNGFTWTALGAMEDGPFFKQVRVTPDAQRMYLGVAEYFAPTETTAERVDYSVRVSEDLAQTWTSTPIPLEADDREMVLLDVDPLNPDRVFIGIHVCRENNRCFDPVRGQRQDRILVSEDRGQTWRQLFQVDEIAAFEINDEYIWVGDWWGGLWRLDRDGNNPLLLNERLKAGCLIATDDALLVCGTDLFGFLLARSTDNGTTLEPMVTSESILGNPLCAPLDVDGGISVASACRGEWGDLCRESFVDDPNPPLECAGFIDGGGGLDGGQGPLQPRGGGCNCQTVGHGNAPQNSGSTFWAAVGLLAIVGWRIGMRKRFQVRAVN